MIFDRGQRVLVFNSNGDMALGTVSYYRSSSMVPEEVAVILDPAGWTSYREPGPQAEGYVGSIFPAERVTAYCSPEEVKPVKTFVAHFYGYKPGSTSRSRILTTVEGMDLDNAQQMLQARYNDIRGLELTAYGSP